MKNKTKTCANVSFWKVYKIINFNRTFNDKGGREFFCENGKKCLLKWRGSDELKQNPAKKYMTYFLWMLPGFI